MNSNEERFVDEKLSHLLSQRCILKTKNLDPSGFVSNIFLVPKKEKNSFRMILNLKHLNKFVTHRHFKMDSIKDVQRLVSKGFWVGTCDIVDAFPHLAASRDQHPLLQFAWKEQTYCFCTMPQGLASAPYEFTRLCRKIAGFLRRQGVYCVFYIDDVVVIGSSFRSCSDSIKLVVETLQNCGFLINTRKSVLTPTQGASVLGFWINSLDESISLGCDKRSALIKIFSRAILTDRVKIKEFARWIGLCISILPCFPQGKMKFRQLEHSKIAALKNTCFKWNKTMSVSE